MLSFKLFPGHLLILLFFSLPSTHGGVTLEPLDELQQTTTYYCIAKSNANSSKLQQALDWTCGSTPKSGNMDCSDIQVGGVCYEPDTLFHHASYAFDLYYSKHQGAPGTCNFAGVARLTKTNPSNGTCIYPSVTSNRSSGTSPPAAPSSPLSPPTAPSSTLSPPTVPSNEYNYTYVPSPPFYENSTTTTTSTVSASTRANGIHSSSNILLSWIFICTFTFTILSIVVHVEIY